MTNKKPGKRKPTHKEILEAARVSEIWERYRKENKVTQAEMAERMGYSTQGAFAAYLRPESTPVNIDFILKFAAITGCRPADIRPSLEDNPALPNTAEHDLLQRFNSLSDKDKDSVLSIIRSLAAAQK